MSGGVDSAVAAGLLARDGYPIVGMTLRLWSEEHGPGVSRENRCCSLESVNDARRVCHELGAPHYVINVEQEFKATIVDQFVDAYFAGKTPNPCVRCNQYIKFGALWRHAEFLGAQYLATGHYARVERDADTGEAHLLRAVDARKDQSYALCKLSQGQLRRCMFPLGGVTKEQTRALAAELGIDIAGKPESQELCFVTRDDYRAFLRRQRPDVAVGAHIARDDGTVVGAHTGLIDYTVGQRKGLGIAAAEPLFVTRIETRSNTIVIGSADALRRDEITAVDCSFIQGAPPAEPVRVSAQIRYHGAELPATIEAMTERSVRVRFDAPQRAVSPGQAVVFYAGERVLGAGEIAA
jgi:tRNA-specific 2-thiouridylase